jgi:hypothetical protein
MLANGSVIFKQGDIAEDRASNLNNYNYNTYDSLINPFQTMLANGNFY